MEIDKKNPTLDSRSYFKYYVIGFTLILALALGIGLGVNPPQEKTISGTFIYDTDTKPSENKDLPITNDDQSFDLSFTVSDSKNGGKPYRVTVKFTRFPDPLGNDGAYFNESRFSNIDIIQFDGIPLIRDGSQFAGFTGKIKATDAPLLLKGTSLSGCFEEVLIANDDYGDLSKWNVSNVTDMSGMFITGGSSVTSYFNQDIRGWDVSNVTNMKNMFSDAGNFNRDISSWNVRNVNNMDYMFPDEDLVDPITKTPFSPAFGQDLRSWCTKLIPSTGPQSFYDATSKPTSFRAPYWGTCPQ